MVYEITVREIVVYWGMFFRRRKRTPTRADAWRELAERLEMVDAGSRAERLARHLALDGARLDPVYALGRTGQPTLYLFDTQRRRSGPAGSVDLRGSAALLHAGAAFAAEPLRAIPKGDEVTERIEAGRSGGTAVDPWHAPEFGERVTVFARDPEQGAKALTAPVRTMLERALVDIGVERVLIGERHILATAAEELPMEALERLASDVFALYAALLAHGGRPAAPSIADDF